MVADLRQHIRWMLAPSPEDQNIPKQDIDDRTLSFAIISAFSIAAERVLGDSPSPESIRELIQSIRGKYVTPDNLQPVQAEAVTRASYGEKELLAGIPSVEALRIQLSMAYGILQLLALSPAEYETYLDEATEFAQEIAAKSEKG